MNDQLPPLPVWHARSFYLGVIAIALTGANALGVDLASYASSIGLGDTEADLAANVEKMAVPFLVAWAGLERRAPNYRLTMRVK